MKKTLIEKDLSKNERLQNQIIKVSDLKGNSSESGITFENGYFKVESQYIDDNYDFKVTKKEFESKSKLSFLKKRFDYPLKHKNIKT